MPRIDAMLILGCHGRSDESFRLCHGVNNSILNTIDLDDFEYERVMSFFDKACGLFDSSISDYNKCSNILNILYKTHKVINPDTLKKIQYYLDMHKKCRPYLMLVLREDYDGKQ